MKESGNASKSHGNHPVSRESASKPSGLLALSPLLVFLLIYLVSSLVAKDFYSIPVSSVFLFASIYAIAISRNGSIQERIQVFSKGAGDKNVLLMIWIFVLAGAFAATAKEIGAIEATVNLALKLLPGKLIYAGLFIASCFISTAIGTSVGTIVALVPVAAALAGEISPGNEQAIAFVSAIVVGGAFFGDNLSFISDTTIAATRTQNCSMKDKFRVNIGIAGPAALIVCTIYIIMGLSAGANPECGPVEIVKILPYILIIVLALSGLDVTLVLLCGLLTNAVIGLFQGSFTWAGYLGTIGQGISSMGDLIIVTLLAGGMLEVIRSNGGLDYLIGHLTRRIRGKRGAELSIALLVGLANLCTANNTIAIITTGKIAKDISGRYGVDPRKSASILDTFSCLVQGLIPYGAQLLMATGLAGVGTMSIIVHLYYPLILGLCAFVAIIFRFPRRYS